MNLGQTGDTGRRELLAIATRVELPGYLDISFVTHKVSVFHWISLLRLAVLSLHQPELTADHCIYSEGLKGSVR